MDINNLFKNIMNQIEEAQVKLGYANESVRLYYPLDSLNDILASDFSDNNDCIKMLLSNDEIINCELGTIEFNNHGRNIEVVISPVGVKYVYENKKPTDFLVEFIGAFAHNHHLKIGEIKALFAKYGDYKCEDVPESSGFKWALYFVDNTYDEYVYCVNEEMGHTIYHRFTKNDYKKLIES